jgi:hypothetical protein
MDDIYLFFLKLKKHLLWHHIVELLPLRKQNMLDEIDKMGLNMEILIVYTIAK